MTVRKLEGFYPTEAISAVQKALRRTEAMGGLHKAYAVLEALEAYEDGAWACIATGTQCSPHSVIRRHQNHVDCGWRSKALP